ncbi:hypothetical protein Hanom_Chr03g00214321 [Helianthus anomalus]
MMEVEDVAAWCRQKIVMVGGVGQFVGVFKKLVARSSLEKSSKKARLEIGSVVNELAQLGSVCKRAELELGLARLVSS